MKAIVLCAGYATRLYPLTKDKPKPLLPIAGKPMLSWLFEKMQVLKDLDGVYIVTNHRFAPQFEEWVKSRHPERSEGSRDPSDASRPQDDGLRIEVIDDGTTSNETRLGAIGDLNFVIQKKKEAASNDLLVFAGDNFFDFDLNEFVRFAEGKRPHPAVALYDVKNKALATQYGIMSVNAEGKVTEFQEKPKEPHSTLASCGIYWLPRESRVLLDRYLQGGHNSDQPGHYMRWLSEEASLFAIPLRGQWFDIGDHASYEKVNSLYAGL